MRSSRLRTTKLAQLSMIPHQTIGECEYVEVGWGWMLLVLSRYTAKIMGIGVGEMRKEGDG